MPHRGLQVPLQCRSKKFSFKYHRKKRRKKDLTAEPKTKFDFGGSGKTAYFAVQAEGKKRPWGAIGAGSYSVGVSMTDPAQAAGYRRSIGSCGPSVRLYCRVSTPQYIADTKIRPKGRGIRPGFE
jgi:hypothetical protein